jgi:hypothetical protein
MSLQNVSALKESSSGIATDTLLQPDKQNESPDVKFNNNIKEKIQRKSIVICFNKMCRTYYLTPKFV